MVGSVTSSMAATVRMPSRSISSTTRSLWTTWPRIAPRPPPAAKCRTFMSATRTPEQNPYLLARFTVIGIVPPSVPGDPGIRKGKPPPHPADSGLHHGARRAV
jgi:hypothetical protein